MRKKILIAEGTDTTRSVAETVLRQNGFEVISVADPERAQEVLDFSRPDLVVVSGDMMINDRTPYHEHLLQQSATANIPMLVFERSDKGSIGLPDEVIVPRPIDPKDFLTKVGVFVGHNERKPAAVSNPLGASSVDDEFLDAALGLDSLDVTDSEVMDKTTGVKSARPDKSVESVGLGARPADEDLTESGRVESLRIDDDVSQIRVNEDRAAPQPQVEASGKLEILNDQYGLAEPPGGGDADDEVHDYDWFVNSMKTDDSSAKRKAQVDEPKDTELTFAEPSASLDPVTPPPPSAKGAQPPGVEKFIDEFKKEIEQLRVETEVADPVAEADVKKSATKEDLSWDETLENLTPQQVELFTRQFAAELGRKVAEMVVAKIDADKLLALIKNEILARRR